MKSIKPSLLLKSITILVGTMTLFLSATATAESVLDQVKTRKQVRIGTGNDTPPMNFIDDKGQWTGFDVDLGDAIAKKLGVTVERVVVNNKTRVAYLANHQIDLAISNLSQTRSREEQVDYAEPPYLWTAKIFYAKKGRFKSIADLGGKRLGVNQGSNAFTAAPQEIAKYSKKPPEVIAFQKNAEGLVALRQGKIDVFCQDSPVIAALAKEDSSKFEVVGTGFSPGLYGIGLPEDDSKWRDAISFALQDLMKDGTYDLLYDKWFGPKGQFPMPQDARPRLPKDAFGSMRYVWPD